MENSIKIKTLILTLISAINYLQLIIIRILESKYLLKFIGKYSLNSGKFKKTYTL